MTHLVIAEILAPLSLDGSNFGFLIEPALCSVDPKLHLSIINFFNYGTCSNAFCRLNYTDALLNRFRPGA